MVLEVLEEVLRGWLFMLISARVGFFKSGKGTVITVTVQTVVLIYVCENVGMWRVRHDCNYGVFDFCIINISTNRWQQIYLKYGYIQ